MSKYYNLAFLKKYTWIVSYLWILGLAVIFCMLEAIARKTGGTR